jgi:hypothetical protein
VWGAAWRWADTVEGRGDWGVSWRGQTPQEWGGGAWVLACGVPRGAGLTRWRGGVTGGCRGGGERRRRWQECDRGSHWVDWRLAC